MPRAGDPRGRDIFAVSPAQLLQSLHTLHPPPHFPSEAPFQQGQQRSSGVPVPKPPGLHLVMCVGGTRHQSHGWLSAPARAHPCAVLLLWAVPIPWPPLQQGHPTLVTLEAFRAAVPHPPRLGRPTPACLEARPEIWPWSQDWDLPPSFPSSFLIASASPALGHCRCQPPYKREKMKSKVSLLPFPAHLRAKGSLGSLHTVSHLTLGTLGAGPIISPIPQVGM